MLLWSGWISPYFRLALGVGDRGGQGSLGGHGGRGGHGGHVGHGGPVVVVVMVVKAVTVVLENQMITDGVPSPLNRSPFIAVFVKDL